MIKYYVVFIFVLIAIRRTRVLSHYRLPGFAVLLVRPQLPLLVEKTTLEIILGRRSGGGMI
jgi:hypothetical protein